MQNDSVKWLIAGLAGALFTLLLFVGGGVAIFLYIQKQADLISGVGEREVLSGPEQWAAKEQRHNEMIAETDAFVANHGLEAVYETVPFLDDTRDVLYDAKDFAAVETRLGERLANAAGPMDLYRYHVLISDLSELNYNYEPEAVLETLDAWVAHSPDAYLPLLVRGSFYIDYGWYYRGENLASEVSATGWQKYQQFHELAWDDLTKAAQMNSTDAAIPAALTRAAAGRRSFSSDTATLNELRIYYEQTLALNPHHLAVRLTLLNYAQPKWFGSWEAMDTVLEEAEAASAEFPFLGIVNAAAVGMMRERSSAHTRGSKSGEADRLSVAAYRAQSAQTPDELMILANAAHYSLESGDRAGAVAAFEQIGNRFPTGSKLRTLYHYHWWRINAMVELSAEADVIGTPREKELLDEALTLDPYNPLVSCMYLAYLERTRDDAQTQAFFAVLKEPYVMTGTGATPPDYNAMKAMALAGRSDDYGIQGTDKELPLLEEALALAPDNAYVRLVFAEHFITAKEYDEARVHLEHAREVDPDYLPALHIMGWLSFHQKRWDEGIAYAQEFLAKEPCFYVTACTKDAEEIVQLCEEKKAAAV